ncbi:MAG: tetratricopeptide repeat protein [Planctomycetota bacterium]|nr:tetratricopeptide repeat protein [Planctomycetota bacterium]
MSVLAIAVVLAALGGAASAQTGADDAFMKGLQQRGLTALQKEYLKRVGGTANGGIPGTPASAPGGAAASGDKAAMAAIEVQAALKNRNIGQREESFNKARVLYEAAIDETAKAIAAIPLSQKQDERERLRLQLLKQRLDLATFVFEKSMKTDLDLLEVTDRRGGNRSRVIDLLHACMAQYKAITEEATAWLSEISRMSMIDRNKFTNTGVERNLRQMQREAKYKEAWVIYYLGWALPVDFKPAPKQRSRQDLLNDAITAFQEYAGPRTSDKTSAKWYGYLVIGLSYRELGRFDEALESLAQAERLAEAALKAPQPKGGAASATAAAAAAAAQSLRIRLLYERALTLVRKGDFAPAREAVDAAVKNWGDQLDAEPLGAALPLVKAESLILEGKQKNNKGMEQDGRNILNQMYAKPNPWPIVVQWVMDGLLGTSQTTKLTDLDPLQIWIKANDALDKAQKTKDAKDFEEALNIFQAYAEKVGAQEKNYPTALYSQAACLLQVGRKAEAGALFRKVPDEFPNFQYALASARLAVSCFGEVYERDAGEATRQAYEDVLKWFASKYLKEDLDQQYFYAMVLFRGKKFADAANAFAAVQPGAEHAPDAKYWVALCHLEQFREQVITSRDKGFIVSRARALAQELVLFGDYAIGVQGLPEEKKKQLMNWAETAYVNAADIYLYPEVELPSDALPVLAAIEQKFELSDEARGRILKLRIDALQKLGKRDEAIAVLSEFLDVAKKNKKEDEVGPVLRGLFKAVTDDVRDRVRRGDKESLEIAARNVEQAKDIGGRLALWLETNAGADKAAQIENVRYDTAELYLAVGNFEAARQIYHEIGGPNAVKPKKGEPMKFDCVYGLARAYEGLAEKARQDAEAAGTKDFKAAKEGYEAAMEIWNVLKEIVEGEGRNIDANALWDRRYHVFYCAYRVGQLGQKPEDLQRLADDLYKMEIIVRPDRLGGKDPLIQKRFSELRQVLPAPSAATTAAPQPAPAAK